LIDGKKKLTLTWVQETEKQGAEGPRVILKRYGCNRHPLGAKKGKQALGRKAACGFWSSPRKSRREKGGNTLGGGAENASAFREKITG